MQRSILILRDKNAESAGWLYGKPGITGTEDGERGSLELFFEFFRALKALNKKSGQRLRDGSVCVRRKTGKIKNMIIYAARIIPDWDLGTAWQQILVRQKKHQRFVVQFRMRKKGGV